MKVVFINDGIYEYATDHRFSVGGAERQQWLLARAFQGMQAPKLSAPGSTKVPAGLQGEIGL